MWSFFHASFAIILVMSTKEPELTWLERTSNSEFVASVWSCSTSAATTRTILADPCISIALVSKGDNMQVVLRGPETKPSREHLASDYACLTIRLQPGVLLRGFPAQRLIGSSFALSVNAARQFRLEGTRFQFPDFDNAELLIDQLHKLGYLRHGVSSDSYAQAAMAPSTRSHSRLIKRVTGLSPYQLHQLQRIHQALRMLKRGMSATAVATELDFVDQSHLTHASKQFLGHTPKQLLSLPQVP
jgi:AraC-like DNA-binding protein